MRRTLATLTFLIICVGTLGGAVSPPAQAAPLPAKVTAQPYDALGDSFAAGTGNVPYQPDDGECDRSASAASSELLARLRLVTLQAFRACQGAKTTDVIAQGQLTAITADTALISPSRCATAGA